MTETMRPEDFGQLEDAFLVSIAWQHGGPDLLLDIVLGDGIQKRFTFTWANQIRIRIEQPKGAGQLLTREGSAERTAENRLSVLIDFGSQGEIRFECESIIANCEPFGFPFATPEGVSQFCQCPQNLAPRCRPARA